MSATQINKCKKNVVYAEEINGECFAWNWEYGVSFNLFTDWNVSMLHSDQIHFHRPVYSHKI